MAAEALGLNTWESWQKWEILRKALQIMWPMWPNPTSDVEVLKSVHALDITGLDILDQHLRSKRQNGSPFGLQWYPCQTWSLKHPTWASQATYSAADWLEFPYVGWNLPRARWHLTSCSLVYSASVLAGLAATSGHSSP